MDVVPDSRAFPLLGWCVCPACHGALAAAMGAIACTSCGDVYPVNERGQPDLRPRRSLQRTLAFCVPLPGEPAPALAAADVAPAHDCDWDYRAYPIHPLWRSGNHLNAALLSHIPKARANGRLLEIGCGWHPVRELAAHLGYRYAGIDYAGPAATLLADAHALPFEAGGADVVVSFAVLEHLRHPFAALEEIARALKPGGTFVGTVAFLEPFHLDSHFHCTHLGTRNLLESAGLEVRTLAPTPEWPGLSALAKMGLFPHAPKVLSEAFVLPVAALHRLWWMLGALVDRRPATSERQRRTTNAGGFRFVARKPVRASRS